MHVYLDKKASVAALRKVTNAASNVANATAYLSLIFLADWLYCQRHISSNPMFTYEHLLFKIGQTPPSREDITTNNQQLKFLAKHLGYTLTSLLLIYSRWTNFITILFRL